MEYTYITGLILLASTSHRDLRKMAYAIFGFLLLMFALALTSDGDFSIMELSKIEILLLIALAYLSKSNTSLDRTANKEWLEENSNAAGAGWLKSKYSDFIWLGIIPFQITFLITMLLIIQNLKGGSSQNANMDLSPLITSTTLCAAVLIFMALVLLGRNIHLRLKIFQNREENKTQPSNNIEKSEQSGE